MVIFDELSPEGQEKMKLYTRLQILVLKMNELPGCRAWMLVSASYASIGILRGWDEVMQTYGLNETYEDTYDGNRGEAAGSLADAEKRLNQIIKEVNDKSNDKRNTNAGETDGDGDDAAVLPVGTADQAE